VLWAPHWYASHEISSWPTDCEDTCLTDIASSRGKNMQASTQAASTIGTTCFMAMLRHVRCTSTLGAEGSASAPLWRFATSHSAHQSNVQGAKRGATRLQHRHISCSTNACAGSTKLPAAKHSMPITFCASSDCKILRSCATLRTNLCQRVMTRLPQAQEVQ
jgi:hypothetical protein